MVAPQQEVEININMQSIMKQKVMTFHHVHELVNKSET